jgi:hypothetical protein
MLPVVRLSPGSSPPRAPKLIWEISEAIYKSTQHVLLRLSYRVDLIFDPLESLNARRDLLPRKMEIIVIVAITITTNSKNAKPPWHVIGGSGQFPCRDWPAKSFRVKTCTSQRPPSFIPSAGFSSSFFHPPGSRICPRRIPNSTLACFSTSHPC